MDEISRIISVENEYEKRKMNIKIQAQQHIIAIHAEGVSLVQKVVDDERARQQIKLDQAERDGEEKYLSILETYNKLTKEEIERACQKRNKVIKIVKTELLS